MPIMYTRFLFSSLLFIATSSICAQNWTVGQAVNLHLSDLVLNSDGCWNLGMQNDDLIYFPNSLVDGVEHLYIINFANPPGSVGFGAPNNIVNGGDTVYITSPNQQFPIYFTGGPGGQMDISVYAVGTPTMPGQNHPCAFSSFWIQNLLICNTGINNNIPTNCVTQTSTDVEDVLSHQEVEVVLPSLANGQQLIAKNVSEKAQLRVFDIVGNEVASATVSTMTSGISLSGMREGIYFYSLINNGEEITAKFVLTR